MTYTVVAARLTLSVAFVPPRSMRRQLAFILARQQFHGADEETTDEGLLDILSNTKLGEHFELFGKELNLIEPRSLEDIYKSHLENTRSGVGAVAVDSAKQNLAGSFVNGFVNAGFGNDKLMAKAEEGQSWIYKNKDHGESVLASLYCSVEASVLTSRHRHAVCGCIARTLLPLEPGERPRRHRYVRLCARRIHQSWRSTSQWNCAFGCQDGSRRCVCAVGRTCRQHVRATSSLCDHGVRSGPTLSVLFVYLSNTSPPSCAASESRTLAQGGSTSWRSCLRSLQTRH